jgi:N-dimethylarginine dimethylaminohydrolase
MPHAKRGRIIMTSPEHYEVSYSINPWMQPSEWARDPVTATRTARTQWEHLAARLHEHDLTVETAPGEPGLPDMVFPANAAIVLDGVALLARFRHPQRQGEEAHFRNYFEKLVRRGLIACVTELPEGIVQEGAGDCIWDAKRGLFWAGYGPRSHVRSLKEIGTVFGVPVLGLELATEYYYHLDTCFCPLPGGEILYYPPALTARGRMLLEGIVPAENRIAATQDEAAAFSLNAIAAGRNLIMARPPARLAALLEDRGYNVCDMDLSSFVLSGGAAYCMTLRLDLSSRAPNATKGKVAWSPKPWTAQT